MSKLSLIQDCVPKTYVYGLSCCIGFSDLKWRCYTIYQICPNPLIYEIKNYIK